MFHTHLFEKVGNTLWCKCGKIKNLPCPHTWEVHSEQSFNNSWGKTQTGQWLICENCGEMKYINITTGLDY